MVTFIGACGDNFTLLLRKSQIAHSLHIVFFFLFFCFVLFCFVFFCYKNWSVSTRNVVGVNLLPENFW